MIIILKNGIYLVQSLKAAQQMVSTQRRLPTPVQAGRRKRLSRHSLKKLKMNSSVQRSVSPKLRNA